MPSRSTFTASLRGAEGPDPVPRWEHVLSNEASLAFRAGDLISRVPALGRAMRVPAPARPGAGLPEREARLGAMRASPLWRIAQRLRAAGLRRRPQPGPGGAGAAPALGAYTSSFVDDALAVMRSLPFEELQRRGWHVQPNHFYWPLNDVEFLARHHDLWHGRGLPREADWDLDGQVALLRRLVPALAELEDDREFPFGNPAFAGADALVYYGLARVLGPRRVVEVGAGWSSLVLKNALARNDGPCAVTLVEPAPNEQVWPAIPPEWTLHRRPVQHTDVALFETLEPGDLCFYDGSHCARTGGDVNWMLFEVLPRLAPGVWVHFHDLFWPDDYPDEWVFDEGLSWNEQYLVQAFLMHNGGYRVRLANRMLFRERAEELAAAYPWGALDGGSLWLEKLDQR